MKVSIIIPTLNEERYISNLLDSILSQTKVPDEVIVVDANSTDSTISIANKYKNVQVYKFHPTVGAQRTFGGEKASGDILFFIDADTTIPPTFLENTLNLYSKHKFNVACPFYKPITKSIIVKFFFHFMNGIFFLVQKLSPSGAGMCIVIEKKIFTEIGGFNQNNVCDDIELIRKASKGRKFIMLPLRVNTSDRRFIKYGTYKTILKYMYLSVLFAFNKIYITDNISYEFGEYNSTK